MQIITSPEELRALCREWHKNGESVGLVPTMGYCHAGHQSLMTYGRKNANHLIVSVFVNPTQFGPNEDLDRYPRDIERDMKIAEEQGADVFFMPDVSSMYEEGHATWVEVPEMANRLCGKSRPVHFRGVCTVVLKLFILTMADLAVFGQKDWQQQAILKRMARDLNLPVKIAACPTVREADGLALSSRNVYLSPDERRQAAAIRKGLLKARELAQNGEDNSASIINKLLAFWKKNLPDGKADYISIVHPESLVELTSVNGPALMACAVQLGKARLIDNIILKEN